MKKLFLSKARAWTLSELLIVLVIIGILILIALPNLMPLIARAKSTEAKMQLTHLYNLQKTHFYMYSKYSADFAEIGFEHEKLISEGGNANYKIEIFDATLSTFKARATAIVDFDGDGNFNIWEIDQDKRLVELIKD
jgi:type IV pilus assembly protein PilE